MAIFTQLLLVILAVLIVWKYWGPTALHLPVVMKMRKKATTVMHSRPSYVKVAVFVPVAYSDIVRDALAHAGAGTRAGYISESFSVRGLGRWQKGPAVVHHPHDSHDSHADHHAADLHGGHDSHHDDHHAPADHHETHVEEHVSSEIIYAEEDKIEVIASKSALDTVLVALRRLHIDSHMAIDVYPVDPY